MRLLKIIQILILIIAFTAACAQNQGTISTPRITETSLATHETESVATASATNHPQKTPTLTFVPTLIEEVAVDQILTFIEGGEECRLPCWLDNIPGQSNYIESQNQLRQFSGAAFSKSFTSKYSFFEIKFIEGESFSHLISTEIFPSTDGLVKEIVISSYIEPDINGNIDFNNQIYQNLWERYLLFEVLKQNGQPEAIFIDTTRTSIEPTSTYPFVLWIVYPEQGFLIRYEGNNSVRGSMIRICPAQALIKIYIWDPEKLTYEKMMAGDSAVTLPISLGPQPIEGFTEYSVESFYEEFKDSQVNACFETPMKLWPPK